MVKLFVVLILMLACMLGAFIAIDFWTFFPSASAYAENAAMATSIPGWEDEILEWMLAEGVEGPAGLLFRVKKHDWQLWGDGDESNYTYRGPSVPVVMEGYEGPAGFYSCGPDFILGNAYTTDIYGTVRNETWRHRGVDYGTGGQYVPLLAPMSGKVIYADYKGPYGYLIVIENEDYLMYLAHLSEFNTQAGENVTAGDHIATTGGATDDWRSGADSEGNPTSTGPHLHFEIRQKDPNNEGFAYAVDPNTVLLPGQSEYCDWQGGSYYGWHDEAIEPHDPIFLEEQ